MKFYNGKYEIHMLRMAGLSWFHRILCRQGRCNKMSSGVTFIKAIGGGSWVKKSSESHMKELSETNQALFGKILLLTQAGNNLLSLFA